jgi:hypothetical protein
MGRKVLLGAMAAAAAVAAVAYGARVRFGHRVAVEARELWTTLPAARPIAREQLERLPAPVRRYLDKAIGSRQSAVRTVRLVHGGTFRARLDGAWLPIRGEQYFTADPPGFLWWGRVRMAPGIWIDARDRSVGGIGHMYVAAESLLPIADSRGPELDVSALGRLLGELAWLPTAMLDERYVTWSPVDETRAKASLTVGSRTATGTFAFGDDDLPATFTAERHFDLGDGRSVPRLFSGRVSDYRLVGGLLVPFRIKGAWHVEGQEIPYVRFEVERLDFDAIEPF